MSHIFSRYAVSSYRYFIARAFAGSIAAGSVPFMATKGKAIVGVLRNYRKGGL